MTTTNGAQEEAWIRLPTEEELRARGPGGGSPYNFSFAGAMGKLMAAHPALAPSFGAHFKAVMFGPGVLTRAEREMIAAVTSSAQQCFY
ncbi:MAG TPA: hypothetical protein VHT97_11655 [Acidimicrobiales bacterium]|nr:hypothetical protein [Acidimicrobiales bacterium]